MSLKRLRIERFIEKTKRIGFSGLIIPDATPENTRDQYYEPCKKNGIAPISIVTRYSNEFEDSKFESVQSYIGLQKKN